MSCCLVGRIDIQHEYGILDRGRQSFLGRAWADAYTQLQAADRDARLQPDDLERLATPAYLIGRDGDSVDTWARA